MLAGYIDALMLTEAGISQFIVPPVLGDDAGIGGAIALALGAIATLDSPKIAFDTLRNLCIFAPHSYQSTIPAP